MCPLAYGFDCTTVVLGVPCAGSGLLATVVLFVFIPVQVLSWVLVLVVNYFPAPLCMMFCFVCRLMVLPVLLFSCSSCLGCALDSG